LILVDRKRGNEQEIRENIPILSKIIQTGQNEPGETSKTSCPIMIRRGESQKKKKANGQKSDICSPKRGRAAAWTREKGEAVFRREKSVHNTGEKASIATNGRGGTSEAKAGRRPFSTRGGRRRRGEGSWPARRPKSLG